MVNEKEAQNENVEVFGDIGAILFLFLLQIISYINSNSPCSC